MLFEARPTTCPREGKRRDGWVESKLKASSLLSFEVQLSFCFAFPFPFALEVFLSFSSQKGSSDFQVFKFQESKKLIFR